MGQLQNAVVFAQEMMKATLEALQIRTMDLKTLDLGFDRCVPTGCPYDAHRWH